MTSMVHYHIGLADTDVGRTAFLMEQLYYMIRVGKQVHHPTGDHLAPTINLFDPVSVKAWLKMRNIANIYGERWMARHSLLITSGVLKLLAIICYSLVVIFGLVHYDDYRRTSLIILTGYDVLSITYFLLRIMASMSSVNSFTKEQLVQVWSNRSMIQELYNYRSKYFDQQFTFELASAVKKGDLSYRTPIFPNRKQTFHYKKNIQNPLYSRLAKKAFSIWKSSEQLEQGLKQMIAFSSRTYEAMRHQENYTHRSLIGHKVTRRTYASFGVVLISALLIALQGLTKKT